MVNLSTEIRQNTIGLISDQLFYEFLNLYKISGNMSESLKQLGLTITQIFSKKDSNPELNNEFKLTHKKIDSSKAFLARNRLRDIMLQQIDQGYIVTENFNRKRYVNPDGEVIKIVEERDVKHNPIPISYYNEFMKETAIEDAVAVLVENDLIPPEISKQILQYQDKLTSDIKKSFAIDKNNSKEINENDLINILKDAIGD